MFNSAHSIHQACLKSGFATFALQLLNWQNVVKFCFIWHCLSKLVSHDHVQPNVNSCVHAELCVFFATRGFIGFDFNANQFMVIVLQSMVHRLVHFSISFRWTL